MLRNTLVVAVLTGCVDVPGFEIEDGTYTTRAFRETFPTPDATLNAEGRAIREADMLLLDSAVEVFGDRFTLRDGDTTLRGEIRKVAESRWPTTCDWAIGFDAPRPAAHEWVRVELDSPAEFTGRPEPIDSLTLEQQLLCRRELGPAPSHLVIYTNGSAKRDGIVAMVAPITDDAGQR